eukprot:scaffold15514_cov129-Cylindrotheca_fusiformis.AAC.8
MLGVFAMADSSDAENNNNSQNSMRFLDSYNTSSWYNFTEEDPHYVAASDVSVDAVVTALYWNAGAFVVLMASYECLRRLLPAVYSSQIKRQFKAGSADPIEEDFDDDSSRGFARTPSVASVDHSVDRSLPDIVSPNWVSSVFNVSWNTIRKYSGLDGYFFLRAFIILVPMYGTGATQRGEVGWYHLSAANVSKGSWRMWEYRHFLELRMDFLARGSSHVIKQHHYSLLVENVPHELRSEKALFDYFDKLFPGKVHSASVILNLKDLEAVKAKTMRVCRRLEKSIAHYHAKGARPTHIVGSPRISVLGVELAPFDWSCGSYPNVTYLDNRSVNERPARGTHVDSISYYTYDLADCNKHMYYMQQRKTEIAYSGNRTIEADTWLARLMISAYSAANQILIDSAEDNALRANYSTFEDGAGIPQAELMSSRYGSFGPLGVPQKSSHLGDSTGQDKFFQAQQANARTSNEATPISEAIVFERSQSARSSILLEASRTGNSVIFPADSASRIASKYQVPGSTKHNNFLRRIAGRLGLDFVVSGFKFANSQLDHAMAGVVGATMSSTGFVTFLDLTSVTCAATTPLTSKPQILDVSVAPEPRDIIWANAHVPAKTRARNERVVNFLLVLGLFFWIIPLSLIQAFANAESIGRIPGMEWVQHSGSVSSFVNGYLPVVALLCLILILPVIFKILAVNFERRKTYSDVQRSMLGRYFYYQVFNIYITVTAGSLWSSLGGILDHPSKLLELLGESLPSMVGYFVALLVTKVLAGLPIIFLRVGALSRMLVLRSISSGSKLTQRELDEIYRPENVQYGWEFPSQLLVIVIVFTYAIISPIILPVGALFFCGSLVVYKKQVRKRGGNVPCCVATHPVRSCLWSAHFYGISSFHSKFLFPANLPFASAACNDLGDAHFAEPSRRLSLERAREYDRVSDMIANRSGSQRESCFEARRAQFTEDSYRQPVLTQNAITPRSYRFGQVDNLTEECRVRLKELQKYSLMQDHETTSSDSGVKKPVAEEAEP